MIQQCDKGKVKKIHYSQKIENRIKIKNKIKIRLNYKADRGGFMIQQRRDIKGFEL